MKTTASTSEPLIFVVDDDLALGEAIKELMHSFGHHTESFASTDEFLERLQRLGDDQTGCVLLGVRRTGGDALAWQARILETRRPLPVIGVAESAETSTTVKLMRAGALAVLDKPVREQELWSLVQEALAKSEADLAARLHCQAIDQRLRHLAHSERQVIQLILEGCKNRTISKRLGVSLRTVENRRRRAFKVMQADSVAELARLVFEFEHQLPPTPRRHDAWAWLPFEPVG